MRGAETAEEGVAVKQVGEARGCLVMKGFRGRRRTREQVKVVEDRGDVVMGLG